VALPPAGARSWSRPACVRAQVAGIRGCGGSRACSRARSTAGRLPVRVGRLTSPSRCWARRARGTDDAAVRPRSRASPHDRPRNTVGFSAILAMLSWATASGDGDGVAAMLPGNTMHYDEQLGRWVESAESDSFRQPILSETLPTCLDTDNLGCEYAEQHNSSTQQSWQRRRWSCGPSGCQIGCINLYSVGHATGYCSRCEPPRMPGDSPSPLAEEPREPFSPPASLGPSVPPAAAQQDTAPSALGASSASLATPVVFATNVEVHPDLRAELCQAASALAFAQQQLVVALQRTEAASVTQHH
jgi:hypothetical protein